jgi:hypothetical protein
MSVGQDGVIAIDPGKNGEFDTELTGDLNVLKYDGDDKNGGKDNQK